MSAPGLLRLAIDDAAGVAKKGRTLAQAAALAAGRASALACMPNLLRAVVDAGGRAADAVPASVRAAVDSASPSPQEELVAALSAWAIANPWELKKARSVPAAFLSASQAIKAKCPFDPSLEAQVLEGLKGRVMSSEALATVRKVQGWPMSCAIDHAVLRNAALGAVPEGSAVFISLIGYTVVVTLKLPRTLLISVGDEEGVATAAAAFAAVARLVAETETAATTASREEEVRTLDARAAVRARAPYINARRRERRVVSMYIDEADEEMVSTCGGGRRRKSYSRHQPPKCARVRRRLAAREAKDGLLVDRRTRATRAAVDARRSHRLIRCHTLDRARARQIKRWSDELGDCDAS